MFEDPQVLHLTGYVYGTAPGNGVEIRPRKCLEARLQMHIPEAERDEGFSAWAAECTQSACIEFRHSDRWHCEYCDKRARRDISIVAVASHLTPPKLDVFTHLVCDADGPCGQQAREVAKANTPITDFVENSGYTYPQAASCANCQTDASAEKGVRRCARCKLIRYCGADCQRDDWKRHRKVCKAVKEVKWS